MSTPAPSLLRQLNAAEVLGFAWTVDAFTASDVIGHTGLTRSTAIGVSGDLVEHGWLRELENQRANGNGYSMGRPARRYSLNVEAGCFVGVDAGEHSTRVIVADLRGDELAHRECALEGEPASRVAHVEQCVDEVLASLGSPNVLAVTIGVPAPVDAAGRSPQRHEFWARLNPGMAEAFADRGWIVLVDNDANLAALAEGWRGAGVGVDNYITMLSGERLGSGIVVDGSLLRGRDGAAGEMEFLSQVAGVGSAHGIAWLARTWARDPHDGHSPSAAEVLTAAARGEASARRILNRLADRFALVFTALTNLVDTELIIVSGAVSGSVGQLLELVADRLPVRVTSSPPRLVASALGENAVALGAVRKALTHVQANALAMTVSR
jgi:predicted NBD/HSP70 family sugar kinase